MERVQDRLAEASSLTAIGDFAAAIAHEVNNPLTGVLGYADLLLAETGPDDPRREALQVIRDEAIRARTVLWALLDFARPQPPDRRPVDLNALIRSTLEVVRLDLEDDGVVILERYGELSPVELDEHAIGHVIFNLLQNAGQAIHGAGTLTISTERRADEVIVLIEDDGAGMPEDVKRRIFEPFFTTRPMEEGRGLGMSMSLGLVASHGGDIGIDSQPGRGTRVEIRLPIVTSVVATADDREPSLDAVG